MIKAAVRPPAVPIRTDLLERHHVHELLGIYLRACGIQPSWAIEVVERDKQQDAALLLSARETESFWFKFIADQQSRFLSLLSNHFLDPPDVTSLTRVESEFPQGNALENPNPSVASGTFTARNQPVEARELTLAQKGEYFLESLLAQTKIHGPEYTSALGKSDWRVAILTPTQTGDYLRIMWHNGLSTEAQRRNEFYIGPDADSDKRKRGVAGTVYVTKKPLAFGSNVTEEDLYKDCYDGQRNRTLIPYTSMAELPIYTLSRVDPAKKDMIGVLSFDSPSYPFSEHDCELLQPLADLCALCIRITQMSYHTKDIYPN